MLGHQLGQKGQWITKWAALMFLVLVPSLYLSLTLSLSLIIQFVSSYQAHWVWFVSSFVPSFDHCFFKKKQKNIHKQWLLRSYLEWVICNLTLQLRFDCVCDRISHLSWGAWVVDKIHKEHTPQRGLIISGRLSNPVTPLPSLVSSNT